MKPIHKYILLLISVNILLQAAGYILTSLTSIKPLYPDILILSTVFSIIALITIIIFLKGQTKDPASQTFHSLVAVTMKFLLELGLVIIWFIVIKKTSLQSVLVFFVIYLTLTLFSIYIILKTLKNKFI